MNTVVGNLKALRARERRSLEKLAEKRSSPDEVINAELLKRAAKVTAALNVQIGLLIGRDGRVEHVIYGSKKRIYLPDLGRFRLGKSRLRRLRFVVLVPNGDDPLPKQPTESLLERRGAYSARMKIPLLEDKSLEAPLIADDLFVDLEKLRLDGVLVVAVEASGVPGPLAFASLEPSFSFQKGGPNSGRAVRVQCARSIHEFSLPFEQFIEELESEFAAASGGSKETSEDRAVLVGAYTGSLRASESSMAELQELARTAGVEVADTVIQRRKQRDPKTVIGKGKLEDLVLYCLDLGADLLVFDRELSSGQLRSITNLTELRVVDRSMLILDIFAQRAKSSEGRLQVELAQLKYSLPRLTETDTGLSRLTGGIGGRGPGETKLEIGRRRVRDRITLLERKIDTISKQRGIRRERRQERGVPVIAIVGYTNAGKSTLLNALTKGEVLVEDKLFATLDPSTRRMRFPNEREVVFVDTVGFIRELPKELVTAFRATLEEVAEADLLVHVVDASDPEMEEQIVVVERTLDSLQMGEKPKVLVLNKFDLLSSLEQKSLLHQFEALGVSALKRKGFQFLISSLQEALIDSFHGQDPGEFVWSSRSG